ncbi:MAG: PorV/PorQ family protein [Elusimicrobia bacterium]|nr:PorV/PorQ family protein [Elusimicrobiota bacterium]
MGRTQRRGPPGRQRRLLRAHQRLFFRHEDHQIRHRTLIAAAALALAGLSGGAAEAAFSRDYAGTSSGQFLKLPIDARGAAMGGAMGAASSDLAALFWNPAGLSSVLTRQAMASGVPYVQGSQYGFLGYAQPLEMLLSKPRRELTPTGLGTLAFGITYFNAGPLNEVDNTGSSTGKTFTPADVAVTGGWGGAVARDLDVGVAVKVVRSQIQGSASTASADAGMRVRLRVGPVPYALSASVHNAFGQLKFHQTADPLPLTGRLGFAAELLNKPIVTASFDAVLPRDNMAYPCMGVEVNYQVEKRVSVAGRAGFNGGTTRGQLEGSSAFTIGGGISILKATFDYAWQPFGVLGNAHRFTLSLRW